MAVVEMAGSGAPDGADLNTGGVVARSAAQMVIGLMLVAVGFALLGQQLGWWLPRDIEPYWPLLLVGFGLAQIAEGRNGYMLVGLGVLVLLQTSGVMTLRQSWPLLLVVWGMILLTRPGRPRRVPRRRGRLPGEQRDA
jgi:hypothetical protein